jgi:hypothetical protein
MPAYETLTAEEWFNLSTQEWASMPITEIFETFLEELGQRRGRPTPGGNPLRFIELADGEEVPQQHWEPDANTFRTPYYYNTRMNVLFKKVEMTNPSTRVKSQVWQPISSCT